MTQSAISETGDRSGRDADTETETIDTIDSVANAGRDQVGILLQLCPAQPSTKIK